MDDHLLPTRKVETPSTKPTVIPMSYEVFSKLPEQAGLQLLDGLMVQEPSPTFGHQATVGYLYSVLNVHVANRRLGTVVMAPLDVKLGQHILQPDVLFVSSARKHIIHTARIEGAPDLLIEVLSPSTRQYDEGRKLEIYTEHGCKEIWHVDLESQVVSAYRASDNGVNDNHWSRSILVSGDRLHSHVLNGLNVEVSNVFEAAQLP